MIILVHTIDANDQQRYFSWSFAKLELVFDVLNDIISTGAELVTIELIDKDRRAHLPVGISEEGELLCFTEVQQLERDWQQLLSVPVDK